MTLVDNRCTTHPSGKIVKIQLSAVHLQSSKINMVFCIGIRAFPHAEGITGFYIATLIM